MPGSGTAPQEPGGTAATGSRRPIYRFGEFRLDPNTRRLSRRGSEIPLRPKSFELLLHLIENRDRVLPKEEVLAAVWPGTHVTEKLVSHGVWEVRQALDPDGDPARYVRNLPRVGYQFVAEVTEIQPRDVALRGQLRWWTIGAAGALSIGVLLSVTRAPPATPRAVNLTPLTEDSRQKGWHWLATDGRDVFYSEVDDPWFPREAVVHRISGEGGESIAINPWPDEQRLTLPRDVSPDGSRLLVTSARPGDHRPYVDYGPLWTLSLPAGTARRLGRLRANKARFSPDGEQIAYSVDQSLLVAGADGSDPRQLVSVPDSLAVYFNSWSPDGEKLCYSTLFLAPEQRMELWEVDVAGSRPRQLAPDWQDDFRMLHGQWTPDSQWLLFRSGDYDTARLWALATGSGILGTRESSDAYPLTSRLMGYMGMRLDPDGSTIYALCDPLHRQLVRYSEASGEWVPDGLEVHSRAAFLDFSPDGQWVVYVTYPDQTLWRSRADGGQRLALTDPEQYAAFDPRWSPDGSRVAFTRRGEQFSHHQVVVVPREGGPTEVVIDTGDSQHGSCWLPDGRLMVTAATAPARLVDLDTGEIERVPGPVGLTDCAASPDGRTIAAASGGSGQLVLQDTSPGSRPVEVTTSVEEGQLLLLDTATKTWDTVIGVVGMVPRWAADGRHLYFSAPGRRLHRLRLEDRVVELIVDFSALGSRNPVGVALGPDIWWYGFDPEGTLLTSRPIGVTELYRLDLVMH